MGRNEFYNYTPDGNRSMRNILAGSMQSEQYQYYPNSDLLQYDGTYYYAYDENGNLTERGDSATITGTKITINRTGTYRHYSWDLLNRLETVEELDEHGNLEVIKEYGYDVNNLRIWEKNRHGQITHYVFDHKGNRIERHTDEKSEYYIFRNLRHIAKRVVDHSTNTEKTYFYGTDHLGSTVLMTDEEGNEVFSGETTPFGDSVSESGAMADTEHLMYTGKDLDEDTGLYYFNARWYDPTVGRFISEDPARFGSNWYRYASHNPLKYSDPTGLWDFNAALGLGGALQIHIGNNDGKFQFGFKVGLGLGAQVSFSAQNRTVNQAVGTTLSGSVEAATELEVAGPGADISIQVSGVLDSDFNIENTSTAEMSFSDPATGMTGSVSVDSDGIIETELEPTNLSFGAGALIFVGFGVDTTVGEDSLPKSNPKIDPSAPVFEFDVNEDPLEEGNL